MMTIARAHRIWMAGLASLLVGVALLVGWLWTRDPLPQGAVLVPRDAPTLAAALDRIAPGGTIALDARRGPYEGGVVVDAEGITIRSSHGTATLRGGADAILTIASDDVSIVGLDLREGIVGVLVTGSRTHMARVACHELEVGIRISGGADQLVADVTVRGGRIGVDLAAPRVVVRDSTIRGATQSAVRVRDAEGCEVQSLEIDECAAGVVLQKARDARLTRVTVRRAETAVDASGGEGISLVECALSASKVAVLLRGTAGAGVERCSLTAASDAGVVLEDARQASVVANTFRACGVGVRGAGVGERALCDNAFFDSRAASIDLRGGQGDLVARNAIRGGDVGISVSRATDVQLLRNAVEGALVAGIVLDGVTGAQVLDAELADCAAGILVAASGGVGVQRCDVRGSAAFGLGIVNGTLGNVVAANAISGGGEGILVAGSARDAITGNAISNCSYGLSLRRVGVGIRVSGNGAADCSVGLLWSDRAWEGETALERLGVRVERLASSAVPSIDGNTVTAARVLDLRNETDAALPAGGNRWSGASARVEGRVVLLDSRWTSTLALGTSRSAADLVLGRLLEWLLIDQGVRVVDLVGLGAPAQVSAALERGDLHAAWTDGHGAASAGATFWEAPIRRGWTLVVAPAVSGGGERAVRLAIPAGVDREAVARSLAAHGLEASTIQGVSTSAEAENLLKFGRVDCAVVDRLEETVSLAGFTRFDDAALSGDAVGIAWTQLDARASSTLRAALDRLAARLSEQALRGLVSRVRLLQRDPAEVAMEYLLREELIGGVGEGRAT